MRAGFAGALSFVIRPAGIGGAIPPSHTGAPQLLVTDLLSPATADRRARIRDVLNLVAFWRDLSVLARAASPSPTKDQRNAYRIASLSGSFR